MEAFEFLKNYCRMCVEHKECSGCPLNGTTCAICSDLSKEQMINIVETTEQWSKEHPIPIVTNAQKLKEMFGNKAIYAISSPNVQALKDWLDEPYKEPKNE